jgi:hypothetical protein
MQPYKISVKFFIDDPAAVDAHQFVPVFHSWIQSRAVPEHMLIDVADYEHVHNGPGTVLIAHEANFYTDRTDGRLGLTYSRKWPATGGGGFYQKLAQAYATVLDGCRRLENDPKLNGTVRFRTDESAVRIHDRLLGPNTPQTFEQLKPDLRRLAEDLYAGAAVDIEHLMSPERLFEVQLRAEDSPAIATLLSRLGAMGATT